VGATTVAVGNGYLKHTIFFTPGVVPAPPEPPKRRPAEVHDGQGF
jgi:hypothetical protein